MSNLPKSDSKAWEAMSLTDKLNALNDAVQPKEKTNGTSGVQKQTRSRSKKTK